MAQVDLYSVAPDRPTAHDPLGRYYTPLPLAAACVARLVEAHGLADCRRVAEPSAGGGAFVRALQALGLEVVAVDADPEAEGLRLADRAVVGDWLAVTDPSALGVGLDAVVGNPPFGGPNAKSGRQPGQPAYIGAVHAAHACAMAPLVAMVLPASWALMRPSAQHGEDPWSVWSRTRLPVAVYPIEGRPWSVIREVALYVWDVRAWPITVIGREIAW